MSASPPAPADVPTDASAARPLAPTGAFAGLGVHGWESVELPILACLLLGEPVMLISEPGAAKTMFGDVIAAALDLPYGYYDLATVQFEDVLGLPIPAAINEGREEYVQTGTTIWDKQVLVCDEVSRVAPEMTSKWLEITGTRSLNRRPLPIKVIIGGMNPVAHRGTHFLDQAFADRFSLFVSLPEFAAMDADVRERILAGSTGLDAPTVDYWADGDTGDDERRRARYAVVTSDFHRAAADLRALLTSGARHYRYLAGSEYAEQAASYCDIFARMLAGADNSRNVSGAGAVRLEARRLKMLKRALLAATAMRKAQLGLAMEDDLAEGDRLNIAREIAYRSLPHPYTGDEAPTDEQLRTAHLRACAALKQSVSEMKLLQASTHAEKVELLLTRAYSPAIIAKICEDFLADDSVQADMTAVVVAQLLMTEQIADILPASAISKLAERFTRVQLRQDCDIKIAVTPDIADHFADYEALTELIETEANETYLTRYAMQWAIGKTPGDPLQIVEGYRQAKDALIDACRLLGPLCAQWGVDGAAAWSPPDADA